jgi:phospholipid/cholesterol/gamma-HCH transport system ATP-binding protein
MAAPPTAIEQPLPSEPDAATDIVVFDSVSIAFDEKPVLEGISFRLAKGETKAIFGVAGSGKSTILKLALGLLKPDAGHIYVLGEDVTQMPEDALFDLRRKIGMVFQESALFDSLTVRENVAFRLLEEGDVSDEEVEKRVREALRFVELEDTVDKFPAELSGGMRRRVAVDRETARRVQNQLSAGYASPARCLHHGHSLLRSQRKRDATLATGSPRRSAYGIPDSPRR